MPVKTPRKKDAEVPKLEGWTFFPFTHNLYLRCQICHQFPGEMFNRLWSDSKDPAKNSPWKRHFFSWFDDPTNSMAIPEGVTPSFTANEVQLKKTFNLSPNQIYWYHQKKSSMSDQSLMVQEYPSNDDEAFLSSGGNIFDVKALSRAKLFTTSPAWRGEIADDGHSVSWKDREDGNLSVWKFPRQTKNYLISADIAEGVSGGDYSVPPQRREPKGIFL